MSALRCRVKALVAWSSLLLIACIVVAVSSTVHSTVVQRRHHGTGMENGNEIFTEKEQICQELHATGVIYVLFLQTVCYTHKTS